MSQKRVVIVGNDASDEGAKLLEGSGFVVERVESVESRIPSDDTTERKQIENTQLFLLQCGWPSTKEDFFLSLARYLAETLDMDFVCIDRLSGDLLAAETVAVYVDGEFEDNVAYTLKDTPCGDVVGNMICSFPSGVRHLFPDDAVLQDMKAEGYVGTTLWSSQGQPIGLIALISRKPLANLRLAESVLGLVAIRAAGELERKRAEDEVKRNEARLEGLLRMSQHRARSIQELLDLALDEAIALTDSEIGYIYHYDEVMQEFTLNTWSKDVMEQCEIVEQQTIYQLDKTGIWGEAVRQAKPIIVNDFHAPHPLKKGYPEGHAPLHRYMTLPIFIDQRIVGVVGVANKHTDYDGSDVRQLTLLMDSAWKITERMQSEEALRESEERYRSLFDTLLEGFCVIEMVFDTDGKPIDYRFLEINPAFEEQTGLRNAQGKLMRELAPDHEAHWFEIYGKIALTGEPARFASQAASFGRWYDVHAYRVGGQESRKVAILFSDITEQKTLEQDRLGLFEREHHIAEVLQQAILPPAVPREMLGYKFAVKYRPALREAEIGGDFYDVFDIGDNRIAVLIGDVAGKGLAAAIRVAAARHAIRSYAYIDPRPSRVMTLANEALCKDRGDESQILTAFYAVLDPSIGGMTYSSAGHEPPIVSCDGGDCGELEIGGMPLGLLPGVVYGQSSRRLDPGDMVVMVTDGITEARAPGPVLFGKETLVEFVRQRRNASPEEIATELMEAAIEHAGGELQDDAAVVVFAPQA